MPRRLPSGPKGRRRSPAGAFDSMGQGRGTKLNCGHVGSIDGDGTCPPRVQETEAPWWFPGWRATWWVFLRVLELDAGGGCTARRTH